MGIMVNGDSEKVVNYNFHRKAGRSIIEHRPVFSPDGESVAIIVENIVRVYNIQTGDCVRTLETESPINELIAIQFPENEDYNLYGCSDTGYVTTWTWENGAVLREIKLRLPNNVKVHTFNLVDSNECCITSSSKQKQLNLSTYSVKTGELLFEYRDTRPTYGDMVCVSLGWCNGDRYAAVTNGTKFLYIQNLQQPHIKTRIINHNGYRIMSVTAHQKANTVAITDTLGRATVIRGNLFDYKQIAREVLHWHFLPPLATCFSLQGNYLYTGGMEKVLVKWTLGNLAYRANEKAFIPRLPGMIRFITTNNSHVALTLTNNSVVIANAQLRVVCTILECGGVSPAARAVGGALVYHAPLAALLTAGRTGHLQLYSTSTDKVLYNLDITEMNNLPSERWNLLPLETEVTCAAVSGNGEWLVTSEYRNDGIVYPEEKLKFWSAQYKNTTPFQLNTCVNLSHGGCNVVSLALNYRGDFCVSAGTDQKFRIWRKENTSQTHRKKIAWNCLTACYYSSGIGQFISNSVLNGFKDGVKHKPGRDEDLPYLREVENKNDVIKKLFNIHKEHSLVDDETIKVPMRRDSEYDMGGVAISQDGSLIAAWFGCKLTLWDSHLCNLSTTLSHPALRPKGVHVQFGNRDAAHYLVCTTETCVAVWSLLSLTVKWLVQINPTCLAAHRFSNKLAVATTNNDVYVFTPHNSKPILTKKRLLDPSTGVFKQCTFGTCFDDDIRLYLMRNNSEIYCIEREQTEESRLEVISHRKLPTSNFSALLAEQQLSEVQPATAEANVIDVNNLAASTIAQFSLASPHMVPPVSLLCTSFLQRLSGMEQLEQVDDSQEDKPMEIDEDSSDDEDGDESKLNGPYAPRVTELWTPNYEAVKEKKLNKIMNEPFLDLHSTSSMFGVYILYIANVTKNTHKMELLNQDEINFIAKQCGFTKVLDWKTEDFPDKIIGYLGDHMKLIMEVELNGICSTLNLFVKCMPRSDKWKAEYLRELGFFNKEYIMLSTLFNEFKNGTGSRKWRPKLLFIKEDIFVFANVSLLGYVMPHHQDTMTFEELKASVETLAKFHAQSYIYEETKSKQLSRSYRIWEHYSDYLQEPNRGLDWRDTGRNAVIDYLKVFSKYKSKPNFNRYVESILPTLFDSAMDLMKPSSEYRNAVVHRDLWTNNMFIKKDQNSACHALFVDFQTVVYSSPMLDLSSLIYFNTTKIDRDKWTVEFMDVYYAVLSEELQADGVDIMNIFDKATLTEAYKKSIVFGLTQAALITPIVAMSKEKREEIFCNPELSKRANVVSRSQEFIDVAKVDEKYRIRVTELFDEIVERFVFPKNFILN